MVQKSGTQSINNNTATKVTWDVEDLDSDTKFASDRFTPTVAGKYYIYTSCAIDSLADQSNFYVMLYFNGVHAQSSNMGNGTATTVSNSIAAVFDMDADDYVEVYVQHSHGSARNLIGGSTTESLFLGYRLTGV
jgi:hypothetical protein